DAARRSRHAARPGPGRRIPHALLRISRHALRIPLPDRDRHRDRRHLAVRAGGPVRRARPGAPPRDAGDHVSLLEVRAITKRFGALHAVNAVDFAVEEGDILAIIGPNGAGKSTLFNVIAGLETPTGGQVLYRGRSIAGLTPDAVCRLGIAKTFQIPHLFPHLTVAENVLVAALYGRGAGLADAWREAREWLAFVGLDHKAELPAESLSVSERRRADLARVLGTGAPLVLLDENMAGLNAKEV